MSLSSVLQPALVTVVSSPLIHTHTPAAKSLAELVQEDPRTDRHVVDQLLKQYELLYKVGVAGEEEGLGDSSLWCLTAQLPLHCRIFLHFVMNWGVFLLWGNLTRGRGGRAWPEPWSTSRCT